MVEYTVATNQQLDAVFGSLSDPIRRDIIARVARREYSVGELVSRYHVSFAAISKHLKVLETAKLISKRKEGKKHMVRADGATLKNAEQYLRRFQALWDDRFDRMAIIIEEL
jgi:DNA-binding transcriptional ArsR family regulator